MKAPANFEASSQFWRHPGIDFEKQIGSPDVFHSNNYFCPRGLVKCRLVYTLYDLSFIEEPAWSTEANRIGCFNGVFRASLAADWIVSISDYTRRHFLSTFPAYPPERVSVIYPASRFEEARPAEWPERFRSLQPGQFWLSVGTIEPRKNQARLLEACRMIKAAGGSVFPLVLAGGNGWLMEHFDSLLQDLEPGKDVFLAGYVSDKELLWLYQNCFALVYPSHFEGFGMPVLEALGLGVPVLCSAGSSLQEAGGDAALYFNPMDPAGIAAAMTSLEKGAVNRNALISAGIAHANRFSWSASAQRLQEVYREVLHTSPRAMERRLAMRA
jgi:glycosyltransferase involved in cell wall biosynthesis